MIDSTKMSIAIHINNIAKECFANGITIDGKRWNDDNKRLCEQYGITIEEWQECRNLARTIKEII